MSEMTTYQPRAEVGSPQVDPTGGRLVAWAQAASAANQLARALSTTTFVPAAMKDPGDATAAILMGDELGLSPLAALRSIYVVHGTPAMYARTMVALTQSHGHTVWTDESTPAKVTVCGQRKGSDHVERSTWTQDRARRAGYTSNRKYETNPEEMLYAKAAAEVCRKIAADVLAGVPFAVEDIELDNEPTATVTRATTARRTVQRQAAAVPVDEPPLDDEQPPQEQQPAASETPASDPMTAAQNRKMHALFGELGIEDHDRQLAGIARSIGREVQSKTELTKAEAKAVIDSLEVLKSAATPPADDPLDYSGDDLGGGAR